MEQNLPAVVAPVEPTVRPVLGVVLARDGQPTLIVRGNEDAHVQHAGASYLYSQMALDTLMQLAGDVLAIAEAGATPDGDGVNAPTLLWAEEWARVLSGRA